MTLANHRVLLEKKLQQSHDRNINLVKSDIIDGMITDRIMNKAVK